MDKELQTKAGFKAWRESLGISKQAFADMMHITVKSVSRWENPAKENFPPQDAWYILEKCQERFDANVKVITQLNLRTDNKEDTISLNYYHDQQAYEPYKLDIAPHYMMENAVINRAKEIFESLGYKVVMQYR